MPKLLNVFYFIWTWLAKQNRSWFIHFVMTNISLLLHTSGLNVKLKKSICRHFAFCFSISKLEQWHLVIMNNRWKNALSQIIRLTEQCEFICKLHAPDWLRFSCCSSEAKHLKLVHLKSLLPVTSSSKQKYKWKTSLWNISYCRKMWLFFF